MSAPEWTTIRVQRFRTPEGKPTCCAAPDSRQTCKFMRLAKFGLEFRCDLATDLAPYLERYGSEGLGHLIPAEGCPVWGEK